MFSVKVVPNALVAVAVHLCDGVTCVVAECADFEAYKALPSVVEYKGLLCGKTGWNSDTGRAFYSSSANVLKAVA